MLFEPYQDELQFIEQIHKYNEREYTVIRLTDTMLSKSIIDANVFVQDVLKKYGLMDYQSLKNGEKKKLDVILYIGEEKFEALLRELKKAEKFIFLEYFIIQEGKMFNKDVMLSC